MLKHAVEAVKYAAAKFPVVQWSAEDASPNRIDFLAEIVEKVIQAGANVINIPDTVGYATPHEYGQIFKLFKRKCSFY